MHTTNRIESNLAYCTAALRLADPFVWLLPTPDTPFLTQRQLLFLTSPRFRPAEQRHQECAAAPAGAFGAPAGTEPAGPSPSSCAVQAVAAAGSDTRQRQMMAMPRRAAHARTESVEDAYELLESSLRCVFGKDDNKVLVDYAEGEGKDGKEEATAAITSKAKEGGEISGQKTFPFSLPSLPRGVVPKSDAMMKLVLPRRARYKLRREPIPANFLGSKDHIVLRDMPQQYVFLNMSTSEVLCTTTAEALAMGKFAIIPKHRK